MTSRYRWIFWLVVWAILLYAALALDEWCARLRRPDTGGKDLLTWARDLRVFKQRIVWPGHFVCTILIAGIVAAIRRADRGRAAALVLLSGALVLSNSLLKWIFGRGRPINGVEPWVFHPFRGFPGGPNQAMPSGDAALAFATAAALSWIFPRGRVAWYLMAVLVAAQRVIVNAHYLSDTVVAAAVGVLCTVAARRILKAAWPAVDEAAPAATMPPAHHEARPDHHG